MSTDSKIRVILGSLLNLSHIAARRSVDRTYEQLRPTATCQESIVGASLRFALASRSPK